MKRDGTDSAQPGRLPDSPGSFRENGGERGFESSSLDLDAPAGGSSAAYECETCGRPEGDLCDLCQADQDDEDETRRMLLAYEDSVLYGI